MKTRETTPGKTYSVHTFSGCTVSDKNGWSKTIDAPDGYFTAHAGEVTIDGDDAADIRELFKLAPQQRLAILGVLGGNASGLPAGYKRVEYLEFTATQRLRFPNTCGIGFTQEIELEITDAMPIFSDTNARCLIGANFAIWWAIYGRTNQLSAALTVAGGFERNKKYKWVYSLPDSKTETLETHNGFYVYNYPGNFLQETQLVTWQIPYEQTNAMLGAKLYSLNLSTPFLGVNMKMIPCLDETGAPCMFDLVSRKPFYNQGAGDFLYPTKSTTYSRRRVLPDWGKLTEHGLRRLYHAPAGYQGELIDYALENGYKPIIEPEKPETGYWTPRWTETEDEIVLEWVETEPPTDEFGLPEEDLTNN